MVAVTLGTLVGGFAVLCARGLAVLCTLVWDWLDHRVTMRRFRRRGECKL